MTLNSFEAWTFHVLLMCSNVRYNLINKNLSESHRSCQNDKTWEFFLLILKVARFIYDFLKFQKYFSHLLVMFITFFPLLNEIKIPFFSPKKNRLEYWYEGMLFFIYYLNVFFDDFLTTQFQISISMQYISIFSSHISFSAPSILGYGNETFSKYLFIFTKYDSQTKNACHDDIGK